MKVAWYVSSIYQYGVTGSKDMEGSEGMVAVVRGLRDAGLAVTLFDSGRQYTLIPEAVTHPVCPRADISQNTASQCAQSCGASRRNSGVQATDGRYASTYKMMHCHMVPTSPPDLVTEFPPQRAELYPGSVFDSKPSIQQDSFTSSLRKYPNMSQERSSEIVDRLITYTQAKNSSKCHRNSASPTRILDSDMSNQTLNFEANTFKTSAQTKYPNRVYEPDACIRPNRLEESPTREKCRRCPIDHEPLESWRKPTFCRTNDVRYLREVTRKVRNGIRSLSNQPDKQPEKLITNDRIDAVDAKTVTQLNTNSVNMEIQAAVPMVSREVVTVPIIVPSQRTIAIPLTPSPSCAELNSVSDTFCGSDLKSIHHIVETIVPELHQVINVQTATSNIQLDKQKHNKNKRSKSQDEIRIMRSEILDAIQDLHLGPCCSKFYCKSHNRINRSNKFFIKLAKNFESKSNQNSIACEQSIDLIDGNNSNNAKRSWVRIFHTEVPQFKIKGENDLAEIVKDWLTLIPLKQEESFEGTADNELIFYDFFYSLKYFLRNPIELSKIYKLKLDILEKLDSLPIETKCDKNVIHNRLADLLINKIKNLNRKYDCRSADNHKKTKKEFQDTCRSTFERYVMPTEDEIKNFITAELFSHLAKFPLKINKHKTNTLENDIFNNFLLHMEEIKLDNNKHIRRNVIELLKDYGFPEFQAIFLTNILITHFKDCFISNLQPLTVRSETFTILPNLQNVQFSTKSTAHDSDISIESNKNQDTFTNLNSYNDDLCRQIDEWMSSLELHIPKSKESGLRQVVIRDLAGDIIDRHKYLELHPSCRGTDEAELEHLKYQIFKWINKLVGEYNLSPTKNAPELMRRIRTLNIPLFSNSHKVSKCDNNDITINIQRPLSYRDLICDINIKNKEKSPKSTKNSYTDGQTNDNSTSNTIFSKEATVMNITDVGTLKNKIMSVHSRTKMKSDQIPTASCCLEIKNSSLSIQSIEKLEAEYEQYVNDWVHQIPVPTTDPKDVLVAEKVRFDIHKSLWEIVSKLSYDPVTYYNRFIFEDQLDNAIDDLLDCLPQTPDLKSQRNRLKIEFVETTINIIDNIKLKDDASLKHKLARHVVTNLRKEGLINNDRDNAIKLHEDLQITKLVEGYLLYSRFKNDEEISEIFKKKLSQQIEEFIEGLKKNHIKDLSDIDISSCKTNIMNILQKFSLPNEKSIKEETDDILLGLEIEQWYSDLPIIHNNDPVSLYQRKKQLEILATKIKDIVNDLSVDNCVSALKNEISRFLRKTLLEDDDSSHINFMAEELVNRINNIKKQDMMNQSTKRVAFHPSNYENFEKDIPYSSSFIEKQPLYPNLQTVSRKDVSNKSFNQSSQCDKSCFNNISEKVPFTNSALGMVPNKKTIVSIEEPPDYRIFSDERPVSSSYKEHSNQWYSLRETPVSAMTQRELEDYKSFDINNDSDNNAVLQSSQSYRQNKIDENKYEKSCSQNINTTTELLEIGQLAGPSGSKRNNGESSKNCNLISPSALPNGTIKSSIVDREYKDLRDIKQQQNYRVDDKLFAKREENKSVNKCSTENQVLGAENFGQVVDNNGHHPNRAKQVSVATMTSSSNMSINGHPPFRKTTTSTSSGPNNKRAKWALSERDTVRKRLSFNDSDDGEDDVRCRCIERYWKCRRRPKYYSCEEFEDLPPCLPVLFPYPCFF